MSTKKPLAEPNTLMLDADPTTWQYPHDWHRDYDRLWQFDRLRKLAVAFVARSLEHRVRLDFIEEVHVMLEFFRGPHRIGVAFVSPHDKHPNESQFVLNLGREKEEKVWHKVDSVTDAVDLITETGTDWTPEDN